MSDLYKNIPTELKELKQWVMWRKVEKGGKTTKIPHQTNRSFASATKKETWNTFDAVCEAMNSGNFSGIGFVFTENDPYVGIDIDKCLDVNLAANEMASKIAAEMSSYTEISPSKTGLHIIVKSMFDGNGRKKGLLECYRTGRYFTFTGDVYGESKVIQEVPQLDSWIAKTFNSSGNPTKTETLAMKNEDAINMEDCIDRFHKDKRNTKFSQLYIDGDFARAGYTSQSEADLAMMGRLKSYCSNNAAADELFRESALYREKWDKKIGSTTYGQKTTEKAQATGIARTSPVSLNDTDSDDRQVDANDATTIYNYITNLPDFELFLNDLDEAYATYRSSKDVVVSERISSRAFKSYVSSIAKSILGKIPAAGSLASVIEFLSGEAYGSAKTVTMYNRIASLDSYLLYDLCGPAKECIKIEPDDWRIVLTPNIFRKYTHQAKQVTPVTGGDIKDILKYVNITDEKKQMLFLVWFVSTFIPNFPHPILYVHGPQGSSKSSLSKIVRKLVDPSLVEVTSIPKNSEDILQQLSHNHLIFLDNISHVSQEMSDMLCRAVTGSAFTKRALYTNDDEFIVTIQSVIGINGINIAVDKPDLLERCILLELERIPDTNRKDEHTLWADFEKNKAEILGSVFTCVSHALKVYPHVKVDKLPRMADFAKWGCAIAEALGYSQKDFLDEYINSQDKQNKELLYEITETQLLIEFMKNRTEWYGTATDLHIALKSLIPWDDRKSFRFASQSNKLTKILNTHKIPLETIGIYIEKAYQKGRKMRITSIKIADSIETIGTTVTSDATTNGVMNIEDSSDIDEIAILPATENTDGSDGYDGHDTSVSF